jgi:hypothetical protein
MIGEHLKRWGVGVRVPCSNPRAAKFPVEGKAHRTPPTLKAELLRLFYELQMSPQIVPVWVRSKSLACSE